MHVHTVYRANWLVFPRQHLVLQPKLSAINGKSFIHCGLCSEQKPAILFSALILGFLFPLFTEIF